MLRVFDRNRPVYHTSYADLTPHRKDLLLHDCMRLGVFAGISPSATPVLSPFTITDLANILDMELPRDRLCNTGCYVRWPREDSSLPRNTWLRRLWDFIDGQLRNADRKLPDNRTLIESRLLPLSQLCLLPASERCLAPINMASTLYLPKDIKDPVLHLEYLSSEEIMTHLHYVYTMYMRNQVGDCICQADRIRIVSSLQTLPILKHDSDDDLRPVSDFYDPDNVVFRAMLSDDMFPPKPPSRMFSKPEWKDFLSKLSLQQEVTPTKFCKFAKQMEREGAANSSCKQTARKSQVLVKHLFALEDTDSQLQHKIMLGVVDVAFVHEARVKAPLKQLHPQRAADGRYISFRGSVSMKHATIAWTQAKLLPHWADPDDAFRNQQCAAEAKQRLGILERPPVQTVAMHLRALCETETKGDIAVKQKVFRSIYSHLQTHGLEDPDVIRRILANTPCVLVDEGSVVFANQTVVDMYETEEIRPYLYKLPLWLGEFNALFRSIGATERATSDQYIGVLTHMYARTSSHELHPNEVLSALKAMAGLFQAPRESSHSPDVQIVFLLSETGTLAQSTRLVYNDSPSFYDRAGVLLGLQFMARGHGCGVSSPEESLRKLPASLQPRMLSSVVSERLTRQCRLSTTVDSLATRLSVRLRSAVFLSAIDRLARHEAHLRSTEPDSERIADATNRLSTINVHGVVGDVVTELVYRDKPVDGSQLQKACFVEKPTQLGHVAQWHVYVSNNADLSLDLLVPLADVINDIMSGLLRDAVLYLQPIITCPTEDDIGPTLNSLNVREHRTTTGSEQHPLIPRPGDPVSDTHLTSLKPRKRRGRVRGIQGKQRPPRRVWHRQKAAIIRQ